MRFLQTSTVKLCDSIHSLRLTWQTLSTYILSRWIRDTENMRTYSSWTGSIRYFSSGRNLLRDFVVIVAPPACTLTGKTSCYFTSSVWLLMSHGAGGSLFLFLMSPRFITKYLQSDFCWLPFSHLTCLLAPVFIKLTMLSGESQADFLYNQTVWWKKFPRPQWYSKFLLCNRVNITQCQFYTMQFLIS